tara:strand:+ start:115 stop:435 length:321 start_codon:yes stop_codon:yes gene_type:complete
MPKPMKFTNRPNKGAKRTFVHRKAEVIEWNHEYLHKYDVAMKNAKMWGTQAQGKWSKEWERYGKQMLSLAKGQFKGDRKPLAPKCDSSNQYLKNYTRPGYLQGVRR